MHRETCSDEGFTLVELLVVIIIIGVLSAIALPALAAQTRKGKLASLKSSLKNAATVNEQRVADNMDYAQPGPAGLVELVDSGFRETDGVLVTVVDDAMSANGGGFCLRAHHASLPAADDLFYASSGGAAGMPTPIACAAS